MLKLKSDAEREANFTSSNSVTNTSRSKIGNVLVSGVGFLADAYDLFVIDFVVAILTATSFREPTTGEKSLIVSSTLAGAVLGQLYFGIAADYIGRRIMFVSTAVLVILGSLLSSLVGQGYTTSDLSISVFQQLALCRFLLGFGIGGEYPLSATVASENETEEEYLQHREYYSKGIFWYLTHKPNSIAAVFSMQGIGTVLSPLIVMMCVKSGVSLEATWRICLGIGAIPSAIAFVFRWRMSETVAFRYRKYEMDAEESVTTAMSSEIQNLNARELDNNFVADQKGKNMIAADIFEKDHVNVLNFKNNGVHNSSRFGTQDSNDYMDICPKTAMDERISINLHNDREHLSCTQATDVASQVQENHLKKTGGKNIIDSVEEASKDSVILDINQNAGASGENKMNWNSTGLTDAALEMNTGAQGVWQESKPRKRKTSFKGFLEHVRISLGIIKNLKYVILGTAATWFLIDVTLYGTGSFKSLIVSRWFLPEDSLKQVQSNSQNIQPVRHLYSPTGSLYNGEYSNSEPPFMKKHAISYDPNVQVVSEVHRPIDFHTIRSRPQAQRTLVQGLSRILGGQEEHLLPENENYILKRNLVSDPNKEGSENATQMSISGKSAVERNAIIYDEKTKKARDTVSLQARMGAAVAALAIPGYILSVLFVDKVGTRRLQFWGFIATAVVFIVLGLEQVLFTASLPTLELILFGLTFLCSNFGPNTTTFIIPTQVYPTILRASCHGFSAAMGKVGGVVGTSLFSVIERQLGLGLLLVMCGFVAISGAAFTLFIPKNMQLTKQKLREQYTGKIPNSHFPQ